MPSSFMSAFASLMPDAIVIQPGYTNEYGDWVASGSSTNARCRIEGSTVLVHDNTTGRDVVSNYRAFLDDAYDTHPDTHRFTLPSRFSPRELVKATSIQKSADEFGACFEVVYFP